jgi:DNA repair exonuclease SbcCD nuclease subunit
MFGGAWYLGAENSHRRPGALLVVGLSVVMMASIVATVDAQAVPGSVVFSALGDYGDGSTAAGDVAALVDGWTPDFIIGAGDNRYGSNTFDDVVGQFYCGYLTNAGIGPSCAGGASPSNAFFPVPGNHDYTDGGGISEYLNYFTLPGVGVASSGTSGNERYYDFVKGNVHFFGLDSQSALGNIPEMDAQKAWLQAQLAASTSPFQVVFLHHPPYSSSSVHGSTTALQWPFSAWGADAVIAGHDHTYERIEKGGIPYFVNGLGGKSLYGLGTPIDGSLVRYNENYGAMRITADQEEMTFEFIDIADALVDSFSTNGASTPPPSAGTVESRILFGTDDVEENNDDGSMYIDSSDIELGSDPGVNGSTQTVGLRFQYLFIPQGVTIDVAYLEFTVDEVQSEATDVVIRAQLTDHAVAFSSTAYDLSSRPLTSASVPWSIPAWNTVGAKQQSPDIAALLQEIIDCDGWNVNNGIVVVIDGAGRRTAESYEGSPGRAAVLHVEYSTPPPGC